jgi:hypothetical protein
MNNQISRAEFVILLLVLLVAVYPLLQEGGFGRLLWDGMNGSRVDPGVQATIRLAMVLLAGVAVVKVLSRGNKE